jgi:phosphatidylcholine synthase
VTGSAAEERHSPQRVALAWGVHVLTASGGVIGMAALLAAGAGNLRAAALLMLAALAIDSVDGTLARAARVTEVVPRIDGRRLDDIVDYLNYVIVPAVFLVAAGSLLHWGFAAAPVLASAFGFAQTEAKTEDHFFLGWPSYWNVAVMYLYLMKSSPETVLAWVVGLSAAIFVPMRYIYPSRTRALRPLSLAVLAVWVLIFSWLAVRPDPSPTWIWITLALGPGYYVLLSALLNVPRIAAALGSAEAAGAQPR